MSRPGITYIDVAEAAEELLGQGKNPTIEQIRRKLGTGSSTTISNHLREWKEKLAGIDVATVKDKLPQDLMSIVKGLWEKVVDQSQEKISSIESAAQKKITELEQEVHKYKSNNQRWQQLMHQWIQEKAQLSAEIAQLTGLNAELGMKKEALSEQLMENNARIHELHQLHQQSQANLDKLRLDMQKQREQDQSIFAIQREGYLNQLKEQEAKIVKLREQLSEEHANHIQLQHSHQVLTQTNQKLCDESAKQKADLSLSKKLTQEHQQNLYVLREKYNDIQAQKVACEEDLIEARAEAKANAYQVAAIRMQLIEAENQIRELEKLTMTLSQS